MQSDRPSKEDYYLNIAKEIGKRGTCRNVQIGAIIVKDDQIISTGYVGAPRKTSDCFERGNCLRRELKIPSGQRYELCRSVHAEMNAIINAARAGVSLLGGDMYVYGTRFFNGKERLVNAYPCFMCKKMIINAGINKVISMTETGKQKIFIVEAWREDWRHRDLLDDIELYDTKYDKEEN
ncbi:dCMP deaminase family protein [Candidatus Woesearchaeota archaeon]|nr:dCMP deaminase family protein [Candidatus Woesearchaeota archaeon]